MGEKKRGYIILTLFIIMLSLSLVSAGFFDFFKNPRLAPSQDTDVNVIVGNTPPQIITVNAIPAVILFAGTTTNVNVVFTAQDVNGASDLNSLSAQVNFTYSGEPVRSSTLGSCIAGAPSGNQRSYTCTITMQYYDENAIWNITASINDFSGANALNDTALVTISLLKDISINPALINFPATTQNALNVVASSTTQLTNNGNFNTPIDGNVTIIATNLTGTITPTEMIPAKNFTASDLSLIGTVCSSGTTLIENIAANITSAILPRGVSPINTGNLTYCITQVPIGISSQGYTAEIGTNPWTIGI